MAGFLERLWDLLAPRTCPICGQRLTVDQKICCASCWFDLPQTGFENDFYDNQGAQRFLVQLPYERCYSMFHYQIGGKVAKLVGTFKYHNHPELAVTFGKVLANQLKNTDFIEGIDVIVPVPLSSDRYRDRGYNQSEMLARGFAEVTGLPVDTHVIKRKSFRTSQTHLNHWERYENTRNAFALVHPERVKGKHVLLIDDVLTTGSTLRDCGEQLLKAGDVKLSIVTVGVATN